MLVPIPFHRSSAFEVHNKQCCNYMLHVLADSPRQNVPQGVPVELESLSIIYKTRYNFFSSFFFGPELPAEDIIHCSKYMLAPFM